MGSLKLSRKSSSESSTWTRASVELSSELLQWHRKSLLAKLEWNRWCLIAYFCAVCTWGITLDPCQVASSINIKKVGSWRIANKDRSIVLAAVFCKMVLAPKDQE
jgi:hypothetical protein